MSFILPALAATLVFTIYWFAVNMVNKKDTVSDRVRRLAPDAENTVDPGASLTLETETTGFAKSFEQLLGMIGIDGEKYRREHQLRFNQAGLTSPDAPIYYLFYKRVVMWFILGLAVMFFMKHAEGLEHVMYIMLTMILGVIGAFGADMYMSNHRQKYQKMMVRSFPDALDLLLVCVESGLALDGALARVCKELGRAHPFITSELNRTRLELTLLNDREQALVNLAERTNLVPFRSLVATLMQSEKFGTSLTDTLRVLSEDYRTTRLMIAENKAGRLPALMTIPLILFMMPAFFLIVLGPAIIKLVDVVHQR